MSRDRADFWLALAREMPLAIVEAGICLLLLWAILVAAVWIGG